MSRKPYKGQFKTFQNPQKYLGDITKCIYRSSWERNAFRWCDLNESVKEWASEEISIYYDNPITGKKSKYYPDLFILTADGKQLVVEIKPKSQCVEPVKPARNSKKYVQDFTTYLVNQAKWEAARKVCEKNGLLFKVWTEDTLEEIGVTKMQVDGQTLLKEKAQLKRPKPKTRRKVTRPKRRS